MSANCFNWADPKAAPHWIALPWTSLRDIQQVVWKPSKLHWLAITFGISHHLLEQIRNTVAPWSALTHQ
ncbi:MAG: hypothetical protein KME55_12405 [Nostoc indistinguendum CM1-VF10]|jgi:hypothetical protein|nr:hypothetical protein [Nostoc indistinguendum CM1-VF10]